MSDREAFEAWADSRKGAPLRHSTQGDYDYPLGRILFEAWTASRKQAMQEAAKLAEESTLRARQAKAWTNTQPIKPCDIAAAIRASASLRNRP